MSTGSLIKWFHTGSRSDRRIDESSAPPFTSFSTAFNRFLVNRDASKIHKKKAAKIYIPLLMIRSAEYPLTYQLESSMAEAATNDTAE
jgi:hypothetical protein